MKQMYVTDNRYYADPFEFYCANQPPLGFVKRAITNGCHDIPTKFPSGAAVASTDKAGNKSPFSNLGEGVVDVLDAVS